VVLRVVDVTGQGRQDVIESLLPEKRLEVVVARVVLVDGGARGFLFLRLLFGRDGRSATTPAAAGQ
jgi:hypothetical protein